MIIQLTGLSGSGKTTLTENIKKKFRKGPLRLEILDGDLYRKTLCKDLGFSKQDRSENIRRLASVAATLAGPDCLAIIAAINPFEVIRMEVKEKYGAKTVWVKCDMKTLLQRDTKGLYRRALLADDHPEKLFNLTGVNDPYEEPLYPDMIIDTGKESIMQSTLRLYQFVLENTRFRPS